MTTRLRCWKGRDFTSGDTIVPGNGVVLADGTTYMAGSVLNYDLPIKGMTVEAGTRLPARATLAQALTLPAGTVLAAAVLDAWQHAAGSRHLAEPAIHLASRYSTGSGPCWVSPPRCAPWSGLKGCHYLAWHGP